MTSETGVGESEVVMIIGMGLDAGGDADLKSDNADLSWASVISLRSCWNLMAADCALFA